jgi:hypothetical protein
MATHRRPWSGTGDGGPASTLGAGSSPVSAPGEKRTGWERGLSGCGCRGNCYSQCTGCSMRRTGRRADLGASPRVDPRRMPGGSPISTLTIRFPDDTAEPLKTLARTRGLSVNKLVEELSVQALAAWDTESRFRGMAAQGNVRHALAVLERLDRMDGEQSSAEGE